MKINFIILGVLVSINTLGQKTYYDQHEIDFIYNLTKYTINDVRDIVKSKLDSQRYIGLQDKAAGSYTYAFIDNKELFTSEKLTDLVELEKIKSKLDSDSITSISFSANTTSSASGKLIRIIHLFTRETLRNKKKYISFELPYYGNFYCAIHNLSGQVLEIVHNNIVFKNNNMVSATLKKRKLKVSKDKLGGDKMLVVYSFELLAGGENQATEYYFDSEIEFYIK